MYTSPAEPAGRPLWSPLHYEVSRSRSALLADRMSRLLSPFAALRGTSQRSDAWRVRSFVVVKILYLSFSDFFGASGKFRRRDDPFHPARPKDAEKPRISQSGNTGW